MTLALAFAIVLLIWIVLKLARRQWDESAAIAIILFILIGWQVFGPLLHR